MRKITAQFDKSKEKRQCRKCGGWHGIGYMTNANNTHHMLMYCDVERTTVGLPFEEHLDIPSVLSQPAQKWNQDIKNAEQSPILEYLIKRHKRSKNSLPKPIKPYE